MDIGVIQAKAAEVFTLMGERLPVGGKDLEQRIRKAGRLLPKRIRREANYLAHAAQLVENPKLVKMVDPTKVDAAYRTCTTYLKTVDPSARRKGALIGFAGSVGFALLAVSGAMIAVLVWRGHI